jgi:hypothetical protein
MEVNKMYQMKIKSCNIVYLILAAFFFGAVSINAETTQNAVQCSGEIFRSEWHPNDSNSLDVIITSVLEPDLGACVRNLKILKKQQPSIETKPIYFEEMAEHPVAVWPMGERILTLWGSGSAFWISVYEIRDSKVSQVLDVRSKGMPEIGFSKNGDERIVINHYEQVENKTTGSTETIPVNADVYIWRGKKYEVHSNVPWEQRF